MSCPSIYDELMSLKLDGLLSGEDEQFLNAHLATCASCLHLWSAMESANALLWSSSRQPLVVPVDFHLKVMARVGALPAITTSGHLIAPTQLDAWREWQRALASFGRAAALVMLSVAGTLALLLGLMASGYVKLSGPLAGAASGVRTFFVAVASWAGALLQSAGPAGVTVVGVVLGLLALTGWQVVSAYRPTGFDYEGSTYLESAA